METEFSRDLLSLNDYTGARSNPVKYDNRRKFPWEVY